MALATTEWSRTFGMALVPLVVVGLAVCGTWLLRFPWRATAFRWILLVQGGIGSLVSFLTGLAKLVKTPHRGLNDYNEFLGDLIWVSVGSFVCFGIYNRRKWARRVLVILSVAEVVSGLLGALLLGITANDAPFTPHEAGLVATMVLLALYGGVMWYLLSTSETKLEFSA